MSGPGALRARLRLLDLFCGAGGASAGYHAAGFDLVGVDLRPQPDYPFEFHRADALDVLGDAEFLTGFDAVHASPPCQAFSAATPAHRRGAHPDLIDPVRTALDALASRAPGLVWVMENVPGAPLRDPVVLCGDTIRLGVRRHRLFEANTPVVGTGCIHDRGTPAVAVYGSYGQRTTRRPEDSEAATAEAAREAMGIDWMPYPALTQAIPPAYTHWIGVQLVAVLNQKGRDATPTSTTAPRDEWPAGQPSPARDARDQVASVTAASRDASPPAQPRPAGIRHCPCGQLLPPRPVTGRWPRYCSHACRQAAYRARHQESA